jgi:hypothetical protein
MKKLLYLSAFCTIPVILFGIANPIISIFATTKKNFNEGVFWIYILILATCLSIIVLTTIMMVGYASKIDRLEDVEKQALQKNKKLDRLIRRYNQLISEENNQQ